MARCMIALVSLYKRRNSTLALVFKHLVSQQFLKNEIIFSDYSRKVTKLRITHAPFWRWARELVWSDSHKKNLIGEFKGQY